MSSGIFSAVCRPGEVERSILADVLHQALLKAALPVGSTWRRRRELIAGRAAAYKVLCAPLVQGAKRAGHLTWEKVGGAGAGGAPPVPVPLAPP